MRAQKVAGWGLVVVGVGALVWVATAGPATAQVQGGTPAYVRLQAATPGTPQTGHANISGTVKVGAFQLGSTATAGHVLTTDATGIGTWQSLSIAGLAAGGDLTGSYPNPVVKGIQGWPVAPTAPTGGQVLAWDGSFWAPATQAGLTLPYTGTADYAGATFHVANSTSSGGGVMGGWFEATNSTEGMGLRGTGGRFGGYFQSFGQDASAAGLYASGPSRGVVGVAGTASEATGGKFQSASQSGTGVMGEETAVSGSTSGGHFRAASVSGVGVRGEATAATGTTYGGYFTAASPDGAAVYGKSTGTGGNTRGAVFEALSNQGSGYGVYSRGGFAGVVAEGTFGGWFTSYSDTGLRGEGPKYGGYFESTRVGLYAKSYGLDSTYGGKFEYSGSSGAGVYGFASASAGSTNGVAGVSQSTSGTGVSGLVSAASGFTTGVAGTSASVSGTGVAGAATSASGFTWGVVGSSASTSGQGVHGKATAAAGSTFGVYGLSASTTGTGVYGVATATSGFNCGVTGATTSYDGKGVQGYAASTLGTTFGGHFSSASTEGYGVFGLASASSGTTYGVMGSASSPSGWALYASGRIGASIKAWRLDHPFDPENRYLVHYSSEGPEPLNVYSGAVVTDARGYASVALPDYFSAINRDPRIQLTVVDSSDDFVMVKVVREVEGNVFVLRTNKPKVKVFWRVEATRNDRWVQRYGAPVEVEKLGVERGKYLDPVLYGMPASKGIFYQPGQPAWRDSGSSKP